MKKYLEILLKFHQELFNPMENMGSQVMRIPVFAFGSEYFVIYNGANTQNNAESLLINEITRAFPEHIYPNLKAFFYRKVSENRIDGNTLKRTAILSVLDDDIDYLSEQILPLLLSKHKYDFIDTLIECAIDNKKHEITAMLIDFKGKNNLYESQEERIKRLEL